MREASPTNGHDWRTSSNRQGTRGTPDELSDLQELPGILTPELTPKRGHQPLPSQLAQIVVEIAKLGLQPHDLDPVRCPPGSQGLQRRRACWVGIARNIEPP